MKSYNTNQKNTLYLECNSGISGDMTVATLLDLGADQKVLEEVLTSLKVDGFQTKISRVNKSGIDCCDFAVQLDAGHENRDHDMEYLHGHTHDCDHSYEDGHNHSHKHDHHHEHRGLPEIMKILDEANMTEQARITAKHIFRILGEAEAKAHGLPIEQVHFHEVGAVDSIVDIVAVAVCLDNLNIENVIVPKVCEGRGTVRCQHGILPIPVPATANIMEAYDLNVEFMNLEGEFVTPTGAAIVAAIMTGTELPKVYKIQKIGYGAGKRTYERPSILRAMLLEAKESKTEDRIFKLESNIDDCTGETLGYVMERLLEAGARDVHYIPVYMKKNRPSWQLNVICKEEDIPKLEQIIFKETTTIGIRRIEMVRTILEREIQEVETVYGSVQVKICKIGDSEKVYPEYESVAKLAREHDVPYMEVYRQALCQSIYE